MTEGANLGQADLGQANEDRGQQAPPARRVLLYTSLFSLALNLIASFEPLRVMSGLARWLAENWSELVHGFVGFVLSPLGVNVTPRQSLVLASMLLLLGLSVPARPVLVHGLLSLARGPRARTVLKAALYAASVVLVMFAIHTINPDFSHYAALFGRTDFLSETALRQGEESLDAVGGLLAVSSFVLLLILGVAAYRSEGFRHDFIERLLSLYVVVSAIAGLILLGPLLAQVAEFFDGLTEP